MRRLLLSLLLTLSPLTLWAGPDELRHHIFQDDSAEARALVAQAVADFDAGRADADFVREVFIVLSRSHPRTVAFVKDWLADEPSNPLPQIARAWTLYSAAHTMMRGQTSNSYEVAADMFSQARKLATSAYLAQPTLIPASDAMIRGVKNDGFGVPTRLDALELVMTEQPNWGSLSRSLPMINGVEAKNARWFCKYFSQKMPTDSAKTEHRCLMEAAAYQGIEGLYPYAISHAMEEDDPKLVVPGIMIISAKVAARNFTDEQIAWTVNALHTFESDQFELMAMSEAALFLQNKLVSRGPYDTLSEDFRKAQLARASVFLEYDPYDYGLLDFVGDIAFNPETVAVVKPDGGTTYTMVYPYTNQTEQEAWMKARHDHRVMMQKRRLTAMPYSSREWETLATILSSHTPQSIFDGDKALENAVVYADDPTYYIGQILISKLKQLHLNQEIKALDGELPQELRDFAENTDVPRQIMCPFLRAHRLREEFCTMMPDNQNCGIGIAVGDEAIGTMNRMAHAEPSCKEVLNSDLEELMYTPVSYSKALPVGQPSLN